MPGVRVERQDLVRRLGHVHDAVGDERRRLDHFLSRVRQLEGPAELKLRDVRTVHLAQPAMPLAPISARVRQPAGGLQRGTEQPVVGDGSGPRRRGRGLRPLPVRGQRTNKRQDLPDLALGQRLGLHRGPGNAPRDDAEQVPIAVAMRESTPAQVGTGSAACLGSVTQGTSRPEDRRARCLIGFRHEGVHDRAVDVAGRQEWPQVVPAAGAEHPQHLSPAELRDLAARLEPDDARSPVEAGGLLDPDDGETKEGHGDRNADDLRPEPHRRRILGMAPPGSGGLAVAPGSLRAPRAGSAARRVGAAVARGCRRRS